MSKMGQEFEKNLDRAKYDLYKACEFMLERFDATNTEEYADATVVIARNKIAKVLAKVEGK